MIRGKKMTKRERTLLTLLPVAIVLAVYAFLFALPVQKRIQNQLVQLKGLQNKAVDELTTENAKRTLELAQNALARLTDRMVADRAGIKRKGQDWRSTETRLETVQQITELLRQFDLSVISQHYETEPAISNYLRDLAGVIDSYASDTPLEYWQIDFEGGYMDVKQFLEEVQRLDTGTFAISLNMNASETNNGIHTWTILFIV